MVGDSWLAEGTGIPIRQGYLAFGPPASVRVRIQGVEANLNIKTNKVSALTRDEFEYAIPLSDADSLMAKSVQGHIIEKTRYPVDYRGHTWEVDVFHGANLGLVVAEIELTSEEQPFAKPPWIGAEVSHDPRYLNSHLAREPYSEWRIF
ncbi:MAG: hypothetical protein AMXMBFR84_38040 [Candidatus Hydrogenedentota bacterium]